MVEIQCAAGAVQHDKLGVTLAHEHLVLASPGLPEQYPWLYDRDALVSHAAAELREAAEAGVGTIVDVSPPDLGRDIELIRAISEVSGVNVVACTGIWIDIPRWFSVASPNDIEQVFQREIEHGIAGSGVRAGVIKLANNDDPGIGEVQEKVLRAAAAVAARTLVPITTHTSPYTIGRDQMRVFADTDVAPHLVAIGHAFTGDVSYLREVLAAGHYLSIDNFKPGRENEPEVLDAIAILCEEGRADHIMLSHDHVPEWDWTPHEAHEPPSTFIYLPTVVRPALSERGVSDANLDAMLIEAPATFLSGGRES